MNETGALRFLLPSGNQILETILFADVVVALCAAMVDDIDESRVGC